MSSSLSHSLRTSLAWSHCTVYPPTFDRAIGQGRDDSLLQGHKVHGHEVIALAACNLALKDERGSRERCACPAGACRASDCRPPSGARATCPRRATCPGGASFARSGLCVRQIAFVAAGGEGQKHDRSESEQGCAHEETFPRKAVRRCHPSFFPADRQGRSEDIRKIVSVVG
jgi:hypothetical protein